MFTIEVLSYKQLERIVHNPRFTNDSNYLVSSLSPANDIEFAWVYKMVNRLKKYLSQFDKGAINDYLGY